MGLGDNLMATGMARGAKARGKRIAFGDRARIIWDKQSDQVFRDNPNIARPGCERGQNIEWVEFYKGHRIYNTQDRAKNRWVWNMNFHAQPGEMFFDRNEQRNAKRFGSDFIVIEPNVVAWKSVAPNKDWGAAKYQTIATKLAEAGHRVAQFIHEGSSVVLDGVDRLRSLSFRDALAVLQHARLYIGPEGGMHHGAAAVGIPAVVIFGGFIPPLVTGYSSHTNLTGGAEACGSLARCKHCQDAMARISVDEVFAAAESRLEGRA